MKKLLTFLMMFILSISVGWAAETTFTLTGLASSGSEWTGATQDGITLTASQSTGSNAPKYYSNGDAVRFYANNTLTVSSEYTITAIELTTGGTASTFTPAPTGTNWQGVTANNTATWSGNATSIVFTALNGQTHIKQIKVTYTTGGDTPQPTTYSLTLPTELTGGSVTSNYSGDLTAIPANTSITVTATANTDYELDWMKANGTEVTNPYTFSITENTTITAAFKEEQVIPPTPIGDYVFYEPFTDSNGTNDSFGITNTNDGNGNDPKYVSGFGAFTPTLGSIYGANNAIKAGTSKKKGKVKTPTITGLTDGATYTLTFNSAPWSSDNSSMSVDVTGGTLTGLSTASMTTGQWNAYTATFVASATSATFEFYATSSNRFFLDEVKLVEVASSAHSITLTQPETGGTISSDKLRAEEGETVTVTATPATGYKLTALAYNGTPIDITSTPYTFTMPDADVTLTATFSLKDYVVDYQVTPPTAAANSGNRVGLISGAPYDSQSGASHSQMGTSVTFKLYTGNGWQIDDANVSVAYTDANGNPATLTPIKGETNSDDGGYGTYFTFNMPGSDVMINAAYRPYQPDLYILGNVNGGTHWNDGGLKMTFDQSANTYSIRIYASEENGYFRFYANGGNNGNPSYGAGGVNLNPLEGTQPKDLWKDGDANFCVPAGIYDIVVGQIYDDPTTNSNPNWWGETTVTVTRVEPEFTFSPAAGEVLEGTTVTATSNLGDLLYDIDSNVAASAATTQVSLAENGTYGDNVTLNADGNVYARATYGQMTYTSAPAAYTVTERGDYYEKVTSTTDLTDGEYLIVYEEGPVAFNGGLETLDAVHNYIDVTIEDDKIYATPTVDAAIFTWNATAGTLKSASGYYIGKTAYSNGLDANQNTAYTNTITINTINNSGEAVITASGNCTLRFNNGSNDLRFRYYKSGQQAIQLYKKVSSTVTVAQPTFDPASGAELVNGDEVTITAAEGCTLKYTVNNGTEQTTTSNTATVTINEATTIVAKAVDGNNNESEEATATYTVLTTTPLAALEANPEQGKFYVIRDMLTVAYVAADGTAYAKDADQDIEVPAGAHDYVATQLTDRSHTNKTANWIAITGIDEVDEGQTIAANTLRGTLTDAVNFTLAVSQQPELSNDPVEYYDVNTYIPCNFMGQSTQTGTNGQTYFFSTPQVNEFAHITNAVLASKTSGTSGEARTYTMTIDGNDNGNKDVHWTSDATSLTWDEITWNTSITWQKSGTYFNNGKEFAQIGSKNNPAATISMSTTGFGGKRITGVSFRASCTNTYGPTLTVTAGSQTLLTDIRILMSTDAGEDTYSTNSANVMMGENDALTFTINSSAEAGLYIYSLSVTYDDATGATGTFNLGTGAGVNTAGLSGEITVDLGSLGDSFTVGQMYTFNALIKTAASDNGAPRRVAGNGNYSIQAVGNVSGNDITTAVDELQSGKAVDGVRYVNVAGQVAATPWQGVNIVVTRYTDGSTRTTKVVK